MVRPGKLRLWLMLVVCIALARPVSQWMTKRTLASGLRTGNLAAVKALVRQGANPNTAREDGTNPLMIAADAGDLEFVRELLRRGADVNAANRFQHSALYWAAAAGRLEVAQELLRAGSFLRPDVPFANLWETPRAAAARAGHISIARLLGRREKLSRRLLKETRDQALSAFRHGFDPGRLARWERHLKAGASPNWYEEQAIGSPLLVLTIDGDEEGARLLLRYGARPTATNPMGQDVMLAAAYRGSTALIEDLLRQGGPVDGADWHPDETPLGIAVANGRGDLVKLLLSHGADPNREYLHESLIAVARRAGHPELIPPLKAHGARE
jgi:uncharacterized protein